MPPSYEQAIRGDYSADEKRRDGKLELGISRQSG